MKNPLAPALITTAILSLGLITLGFMPRVNRVVSSQHATSATPVAWQAYDSGLTVAKSEGKFAFIQFFANWCGYCKKMDQQVLTDSRVQAALSQYFVPIRVTESSDNQVQYQGNPVSEKELTVLHKVSGFPTLLFLEPDGTTIAQIPGFINADEMTLMLTYIGSGSYKTMKYDQYKTQHS